MHFDDDLNQYLAKLRLPLLVQRFCPDCAAMVVGKGDSHARDLLAIHREGTCQGGEGVNRHGDGDPAPADPPEDDVRLTPPGPRPGLPPKPGRD